MTARTVVKWPDPRLLKQTSQVENFDDSLFDLVTDLNHTMISSFGAGIAAPQVGFSLAVCVISKNYVPSLQTEDHLNNSAVVLINPKIVPKDKETFQWEESCLSVPQVVAKVKRHANISLSYQNLSGDKIEVDLTGVESATVQHEADHLIGKLFIHRLTGLSKRVAMQKLRKQILKSKGLQQKSGKEHSTTKLKNIKTKKSRSKRKKTFGKNKKRK
tara:strand:- start:194 stop:841 length:648 start_codon:yes stop_codon:yes gene_type:complete